MKCRQLIYRFATKIAYLTFICAVTTVPVYAETIPEPALSADDLFRSWEAVAELASAFNAVYRMEITKQESYLIEIRKYPKSVEPYFIARLVSSRLNDGKLKLTFTTFGATTPYESLEIEGSAFGKKDNATISGKLTKRHGDYSEIENVTFRTAPMFGALLEASKEAEAALKRQRTK